METITKIKGGKDNMKVKELIELLNQCEETADVIFVNNNKTMHDVKSVDMNIQLFEDDKDRTVVLKSYGNNNDFKKR